MRRRFLLFLAVPSVFVFIVALALLLAVTTEPGLRTLLSLTNYFGKGQVVVHSGEGRLSSGLNLSGLRYAGAGTELSVDKLQLQWQPRALFHRELRIATLRISGVILRLPVSEESEPAEPQQVRLPAFTFPAALRSESVILEDLRFFSGEEEQFHLVRAEAAQLFAEGQSLQFERLAAKTSWMDVQIKGQVHTEADYPLQLELDYALDFEGYGPIRGKGQLTGDFAKLGVQTSLSAPQEATLQGELIEVLNDLHWQAILQSPQLALDAINGSWPAQVFDQVHIEGSGDIRSYDLKVNGRVISKEFRRPLALQSTLQVGWEGLVVHALRLADTAGRLDLAGSLDWNPVLAWDAKLTSKGLNPDIVVENLPGSLEGNLASQGSWANGVLATELQIDTLQGQLRGYPLSASGAANYREGVLTVPGLNAAVGRTTLAVQGTLQEKIAFELQLHSPDLQELLPQLAGSMQVRAKMQGSRQEPAISIDLQGNRLAFSDNRMETLVVKAQGVWNEEGHMQAEAQAKTVQLGAAVIEEANASLQGNFADHTLTLEANSKDQRLSLKLAGKKSGETWLGEMRQLQLQAPVVGTWQQQKAANIEVSAQHARFEPLCMQKDGSSLCVNGEWRQAEQRWQGSVQASALALEHFQQWLPPEVQVDGVLNLNVEATGQGIRLLEGRMLGTTPGLRLHFVYGGSSEQNLQWKTHHLEATYKNNRLEAVWRHELEDGSSVDAQLVSSSLPLLDADIRRAPVQGKVNLDIRKLAFLNALTAQRSRWSGMLLGDVQIGGSVGQPVISGKVELQDGEVLVPELGLRLSPLQVAISGSDGVLTVDARANSQEGQVQVGAGVDLNREDPVFLPVTIQGDSFRVVNQPGFELDVSPDIQVHFTKDRVDVNGRMAIPHARIETITFESAITPSGDVVVVDEPSSTPMVQAGVPFFARILIVLGEDVLINTYGLRARINGQLELTQAPGRPTVGNGQLNVVEGSFSVYSNRVKIDSGRLLFSGGSLANPGIEIRSENTEDNITAGMRVNGSLKAPRIDLYSRPHMDQGAIVSHLIEDNSSLGGSSRRDTGLIGDTAKRLGMGGLVPYLEGIKQISMIDDIKLDTEKDSTSLVFGSWLTPDFYVSYGKSLTGEGATFTTRYTLGKGFVVETESGETQSSGDIKYEFEH